MSDSDATKLQLEEDERRHRRYEGRLEASLIIEGDSWRCWIRDISSGGAGIEPAIPAALGKEVRLSSPHFHFEGSLPGRVINVARRRTCLTFDLDPPTHEKLMQFLSAVA